MKKLAYFSAAILALIACNRQIETDNPQPEKQTLTFRAVLEQPDTKADLSDYSVVWQEGDQIAVFNGTTWVTSDELTAADIENEGRYADFQVTIDEGETYYAIYPASAAPSEAVSDDAVTVTLPAVQTIAPGNVVAKDALVQVCKTADRNNMVFKNVASLVEFKAPEDVDGYVCFEAFDADGAALNIAGAASVNAGTPVAVTGDATKVTVKGSLEAGQNYFAVVYPQSGVSKFRFAFSKEDATDGTLKAFRTGSAGTIEFPLNGGKKFSDLGTLSWIGPLSSKNDLDKWAKYADYYLEGETVKLGADIDYEGGTWKPVNGNAKSNRFGGVFDGQGYSIYNIIISTASGTNCGFFSNLTSATQQLRAKNLKLGYNPATNEADGTSKLEGTETTNTRLGALAGLLDNSDIEGIETYINVSATQNAEIQIGGMIGRSQNTCKIKDCSNYATVDAKTVNDGSVYVGGLLAALAGKNSEVLSCRNYGTVQRSVAVSTKKGNTFLAGILGRVGAGADDVVIYDCINKGTIRTTRNIQNKQVYIGGIICMDNTITTTGTYSVIITDCKNEGTIECTSLSQASSGMGVGGIIGYIKNVAKVSGCTNTGTISKPKNHNSITSRFGGIVGWSNSGNSIIENCTNGSDSDSSLGKILSSEQTTANETTIEYYGGIVGNLENGSVNGCKNYGSITTNSTTANIHEHAGGLVGAYSGGSIENCHNYGTVSVAATTDDNSAGGIVGKNIVSSANTTGTGCSVSASVSCGYTDNAGAVVGLYANTAASTLGSSDSPVAVSGTVNGTTVTAANFESLLAGTAAGITASGVASGLNTIWATFAAE